MVLLRQQVTRPYAPNDGCNAGARRLRARLRRRFDAKHDGLHIGSVLIDAAPKDSGFFFGHAVDCCRDSGSTRTKNHGKAQPGRPSDCVQLEAPASAALTGCSALVEGDEGACRDGTWQDRFRYARAWTIAGGSNEIMRNLIAERALGLPREPRG